MSQSDLRGAVVWAVVPYLPEAPFRLYRADAEPLSLPDPRRALAAGEKTESEFSFIVRAKARPVLVLARLPDPRIEEYFGPRLVCLSELSADARSRVLDQEDELLFHARADRTPELHDEFAVMIAAPVRFHASAHDTMNILGRQDVDEMRVIQERVAKLLSLDLFNLVRGEIVRLRDLQRQRQSEDEILVAYRGAVATGDGPLRREHRALASLARAVPPNACQLRKF